MQIAINNADHVSSSAIKFEETVLWNVRSLRWRRGWTEGACEHLTTVACLANSFVIPCNQSLTELTATKECPTEKVADIDGECQWLQGAYVKVTGYHYAIPPRTSGTCGKQDLQGMKTALEASPTNKMSTDNV